MSALRPIVFASAGVCAGAEALSNAAYMIQVGGVRWVSVADVAVPLGFGAVYGVGAAGIAAIQAIAATSMVQRRSVSAGALALVCLAFSLPVMALNISERQRAREDAAPDEAKYVRLDREHKRVELELEQLGAPRPADVIAKDIQLAPTPEKIWTATRQCQEKLEDLGNKRACEPVLKLYQERGNRARMSELEPKLAELRRELGALAKPAAAGRTSTELWLHSLMPWIFALVLEGCGTFGFALAGSAPQRKVPAPVQAPPRPTPAEGTPPVNGHAHKSATQSATPDLLDLLTKVRDGAIRIPGATLASDGWLEITNRGLAPALGVTGPTVSRQVETLVASGAVIKLPGVRCTRLKIN